MASTSVSDDVAINGANMATGADVVEIDSITTIEQEQENAQTEFLFLFFRLDSAKD